MKTNGVNVKEALQNMSDLLSAQPLYREKVVIVPHDVYEHKTKTHKDYQRDCNLCWKAVVYESFGQ